MWDAQLNDTQICTGIITTILLSFVKLKIKSKFNLVQTYSGQPCMIPFKYHGLTYYNCILNGPNNPLFLPQCMLNDLTWSFCQGNLNWAFFIQKSNSDY